MIQTGWRKPTPGLGVAEQHAQAGEHINIPKSRAFVAVKRVAHHIGLKAGDMLLLDTLGAYSQSQDWEAGQRPIVWASNTYLMEQTGFSLSTLKRHARRLAEAGVIAFRDSPNGKRWGRRNERGVILEAYGFDLSPLAARVGEFEDLQARLKAERAQCQMLKRQITVSRRMIRARLEMVLSNALEGPWRRLHGIFQGLLSQLPKRAASSATLEQVLALFRDLQERIETAYRKAFRETDTQNRSLAEPKDTPEKTSRTDPSGAISEPHIPTTKEHYPVISNEKAITRGATEALGKTDAKTEKVQQPEKMKPSINDRGHVPDVRKIARACPEFAEWARILGGSMKDWTCIHRIANQLRPMIGVSERDWTEAQRDLGLELAAAAMVLVFDKHAKGEVVSPGGYLNAMVRKSASGELHLNRSIYGRLARQAA